MISSFFGKTKPINYIVLSVFIFLIYGIFSIFDSNGEISLEVLPIKSLILGVLLLSVYIISRIVKVEKVTELSSFAILFFTLLLMVFSDLLRDNDAIFTNFFLLLAIWRLLAIKSVRDVKHKIFDASFLICVASLFYDWALIFLILVFIAINVYDRKPVKNWIVPLTAIITVFILLFTILRLNGSLDFFEKHYQFRIGFLNNSFFSQTGSIKLLIYVLIVLILMFLVFLKVRQKGGGKLVLLRMVFLAFAMGAIISFLEFGKASLVVVTFFPAAVFLTNYLETIKNFRLRELVVGGCICVSLLLFVLDLNL
ncbi:DUF6427 family protein [Flagellimonas onchidii]|uniref:DUF6427 family protein n=1 Tax=Flagellimonas onchidii TaxID=2562684 RepID=UPI0010A5C179|nr:DUF6427 family protein [Allomuricauda onchidii]